jgi:hypothetical protein
MKITKSFDSNSRAAAASAREAPTNTTNYGPAYLHAEVEAAEAAFCLSWGRRWCCSSLKYELRIPRAAGAGGGLPPEEAAAAVEGCNSISLLGNGGGGGMEATPPPPRRCCCCFSLIRRGDKEDVSKEEEALESRRVFSPASH